MVYHVNEKGTKFECYSNMFLLDKDSEDVKTTISYAICQILSIKYFNKKLQPLTTEFKKLGKEIKEIKKSKMSSKDLNKLIGQLYLLKHNAHNDSEIFDKFHSKFGQQDTSEYYDLIQSWYHIDDRTEALNSKFDL